MLKINTPAEKTTTKASRVTKKTTVVNTETVKSAKPTDPNTAYATGRRKNAIARVWVKLGKGQFTVNKKPLESYFVRLTHQKLALKMFNDLKVMGQYDVVCTVKGGGLSGQVGAVIHGIARALSKLTPEFHPALRGSGLLTRDSRVVERKKYGHKKARKSTPFKRR